MVINKVTLHIHGKMNLQLLFTLWEMGKYNQYSNWKQAGHLGGQSSSSDRREISLFRTSTRLVSGPTKTSNPRVPRVIHLGINWAGHDNGHSPPTTDELMNMWIYTYTAPYAFMVLCLI